MLHLDDEDWQTVQKILRDIVPDDKVIAFGSRVHGRHLRKFSGLDLAAYPKESLPWCVIGELKDAFEYSDLPIRVDVIGLADANEEFRQIILREYLIVQKETTTASSA